MQATNTAPQRAYFPIAPRALDSRYVQRLKRRALWSRVVGIAIILGYTALQAYRIQCLLHEDAVWQRAGQEVPAEVWGRATSFAHLSVTNWLHLQYAGCGGVCRETLNIDTLWQPIEVDRHPTVRFDPAIPHDFALSTAVAQRSRRLTHIVWFIILTWPLGLIFFYDSRRAMRQLRLAQAACGDASEVECELVKVTTYRWLRMYVYQLPEVFGARGRLQHFEARTKHEPPLLTNEGRTLIALVPIAGPLAPFLPRADGYPFLPNRQGSADFSQRRAGPGA